MSNEEVIGANRAKYSAAAAMAEAAGILMAYKYEKSPTVAMCLSRAALDECSFHVGPSFSYELRVHPLQAVWARHLVRAIAASTEPHPFAPSGRSTRMADRWDRWVSR